MDVGLMMIFASYGWDNIGDDFGFVPDPKESAKSAASDFRSALEG